MGSLHQLKKKESEVFDEELWLPSPQKKFEGKERLIAKTVKEALERIIYCNRSKEHDLETRLCILEKNVESLLEEIKNKPIIKNITIYDLNSNIVDLIAPINIIIEDYADEVLAKFPETESFFSGEVESEAINGLKEEIVLLFLDLKNSKEKLGPLPRKWLRTLTKIIK